MLSDAPGAEGAAKRWDDLLHEAVTDDGLVDYDQIEAEREVLDDYVAWLALDQGFDKKRADRHARWLNAYNALTIYQVLERGRPQSVLDVSSLLPVQGAGFFVMTEFEVGPDRVSLSEIQHERIRMAEMDYRDHAAMTFGARSAPPLRNRVYTRKMLPSQLRSAMRAWMSDPQRGVRIENGEAVFNPIFDWYANDFEFFSGGENPCLIAAKHVSRPELAAQLEDLAADGCPHRTFEFDWRLNDANASD